MVPDVLREADPLQADAKLVAPQAEPWKFQISYTNVVIFGYLHLSGIYGLFFCVSKAHWATLFFSFILLIASVIGVTAGAHRLWSHRSYKANLPLQIILMLMQSLSGQYTAFNWARDHRLHHKYSDTDADPHNATRGFFYSHIGWLLVVKHPEVRKRGEAIDLSDLLRNPVLTFQRKNVVLILALVCYIMPTAVPMYFWGETFHNAWHIMALRFVLCLNFISLINSAAHTFGNKPYDKSIMPTQNMSVTLATLGEGFHNYHHVFPFDYRAAELGNNTFNLTTKFIDFFAMIGWATALKTVGHESILRRAQRTGDGSLTWESDCEVVPGGFQSG
uniref:Acyl-CoA Z6 desaturase n=1 Tax=Planotortrix octo TaxID=65038 RepID=G8FQ75_9NEOP|nr:acyl-CoA Z6 desaturase [Planotortrix octo]